MRLNCSREFAAWVLLALSAFIVQPAFSCGLDWSLPVNHFDGVNERGMVSYWEVIDKMDFGEGLEIPLIINFRSDRTESSAYLGSGWLLPILESRFYQISDKNFLMVQPDGGNRYFFRTNVNDDVLKDKNGWLAEIKGSTITAWAECGWRLEFTNGKLAVINTPEHRRLALDYQNGHAVLIREGDKVLFKANFDPMGEATSLEFNERLIGVELSKRPIVVNIGGHNTVSTLVPSLARLEGVSAQPKEYIYSVNDKTQPTLTVRGNPPRVLTWDPSTKLIISDNQWSYKVEPGKELFAYAAIERKNAKGGTEYWYNDRLKGVETTRNLDGVRLVSTFFTGGLLAGKLHRVEKIMGGNASVERQLSYDESGSLIREMDSEGIVTIYGYNKQHLLVEITRDGKRFSRSSYDENGRLKEDEILGAEKSWYSYDKDGTYEKTVRILDGSKSVFGYDKNDRLISVKVDGQMANVARVATHSSLPLTSEKRDAAIKECYARLGGMRDLVAQSDLLIHIGGLFLDESMAPLDPTKAIDVFKSVLENKLMDNYAKGQACSWIASAFAQMAAPEPEKGRQYIERLLALDDSGLSVSRQQRLRSEKLAGFRHLLAIVATGQSVKDERVWRQLLEDHGNTEEYKKAVENALMERKLQLAREYHNN